MLMKVLTVLGNVVINVVISRIQMWWAKRQAEYYRKKAEVEQRKLESMKSGKATESTITKAGDSVVLSSEKAESYESKLAELRRRAEERANNA